MPTYFARGITARLGAMPLEDTITTNIVRKKGETARQQADTSKAKLLESKLLAEKLVPFPGDENKLHVNWLGNAPFIQVRAGKELFAQGSHATTDTTKPTDLVPTALILHLHLLDKTFVSGLQGQKTSLKIEVLFNGQLSDCRFIPAYHLRSGAQGQHHTFSGTRIDFLAERPWILISSESTAAGTARKNDNSSNTSAEERWRQICQALQNEVCERGTDEAGNVPPTAHFLSALASMRPPDQVYEMQQLGKKTFGTIDIIVTAGEGKKITGGLGYLKAPQRMVDTDYPLVSTSDSNAASQHGLKTRPKVVHVDAENELRLEDELRPKKKGPMTSMSSYANDDAQSVSNRATIGAPLTWKSSLGELSRAINETSPPGLGKVYKQVSDEHDIYRDRRCRLQQLALTPSSLIQDRSFNTFAPQLYLSPYGMQPSEAIAEGAISSGMKSQMTSPTSVRQSSLLDRLQPSSHNLAQRAQIPLSIVGMGVNQVLSCSSPYTMPHFMPKRSTADSLNVDLSPLGYPVPPRMPKYQDPNGVDVTPTNMDPRHHSQPPIMHGPQSPHASVPPFHHRPSGALPPIDFYSVPTKPKRSLSLQKISHSKRAKKLGSRISISRLIVKGRNGTVLVDHRWTPARSLGTTSSGSLNHHDQTSVNVTAGIISGLAERDLGRIQISGSTKSSLTVDCSPQTLAECNIVHHSIVSNIKEKHAELRPEILLDPWTVPSTSMNTDTDSIEKAGSSEADIAECGTLATEHPWCCTEHISKTRPASETRIVGVQGPEANSFGLEDHAVILREASATRRQTRHQTTQCNMQTVEPTAVAIGSVMLDSATFGSANTSPLSSLHTTPDLDIQTKAHIMSTRRAPSSLTETLAEMRCYRERELRSIRAHTMQISSHAKPNPTSQFCVGQHAPTPAESTSDRKLQASNRNIAKETRSPRRLQTNDNPIVNRDCVIAFAESKTRTSTQGVLRQIKGERAGIFREEYVVSAMRFFVEDKWT
ncbi:hypothetical protein PTTW11_11138 [Pyrenophora teres f. teres]|uniref:Uncharacterized protein n=1 Tax=Pyrenophora teres f. teres TaxID=97479 RepID=A0A6S6WHB8_9PLEO|nr:hypothetical protein PTTW11_11138 [Pyrenophora teres f. teres]